MKKITFFIYDMYKMGGTERVLSIIANKLVEKYDVEIVSIYKYSEKPAFYLNPKIKIINILEKELTPYKLYYFYLAYKIRKALKNYKTDIFICAGMRQIDVSIFMRKKAKYIAWEHSNSGAPNPGVAFNTGRKLAAKYADNIVVLTKKDMQLNKEMFGSEGKITHIYNPISVNISNTSYDIDSKKIVSVGRLEYEKGYDMLVEVASKVFAKHPDWEWHIYGAGNEKENLEKLILENQIQNNLKLVGTTNTMQEKYKEYAMSVMTSRHEGFPMVNIEAHSAKLPIVSFNCNCGPDEIIQDGVNGFLIDCFDIDKMADKINYLIENPKLRKEMSDNTMLDKEKLDIENIIKEWEKIL